jgi:undecaprenyl pyrophosphate phosphatase UppP
VIGAGALITTLQAVILGVLQGVSELFPISSLGHTVLFPHLFGWSNIVRWQSRAESPWLAFIVMLHVGSAIGLLVYFWRDWVTIVRAFVGTLRRRRIETSTERLAWLIVVASIPVAIIGLALEHTLRVATARPEIAAIFLTVNGLMLLGAERLRRRSAVRELARHADHPRRRRAEARRSARTQRRRGSAAGGADRRRLCRGHRGRHRALPHPLVCARQPAPVRGLLPGVRSGDDRL